MEPFHGASDVREAHKRDVELVIAGRYPAKDLHALEKILHQVARLVAVRVQDARVLFAVDQAGNDDFHGGEYSIGADNPRPPKQFKQDVKKVAVTAFANQQTRKPLAANPGKRNFRDQFLGKRQPSTWRAAGRDARHSDCHLAKCT